MEVISHIVTSEHPTTYSEIVFMGDISREFSFFPITFCVSWVIESHTAILSFLIKTINNLNELYGGFSSKPA